MQHYFIREQIENLIKRINDKPQVIKMKRKGYSKTDMLHYDNPTILDIGCGIGCDTFELAKILESNNKPGKLIGIDNAEDLILYARTSLSSMKLPEYLDISFLVGSVEEMNFEKETFDIIFISCTLAHIQSPLCDIFSKIHNVLKVNGRLVIIEPDTSCSKYFIPNTVLFENISKLHHLINRPSQGGDLSWMLPRFGFAILEVDTFSVVSREFASNDPNWSKLKSIAKIGLENNIFQTEEETSEFIELFIKESLAGNIMYFTASFIFKVVKKRDDLK